MLRYKLSLSDSRIIISSANLHKSLETEDNIEEEGTGEHAQDSKMKPRCYATKLKPSFVINAMSRDGIQNAIYECASKD